MKNLKVSLLFTILVFVLSMFLSCDNSVSSSNSYTNDRVYKAVDSVRLALEQKLAKVIPSLSVLVQTPKEIIFVSSVHQNFTPLTMNTYFRFASNTKNFTSTAVLNMYEDGWLDIHAKIIDTIPGSQITYVPSSSEWDIPYKNQITIEQLLQHSAGVYDLSNDTVPGCNNMTYVEYMEKLDPSHQFSSTELVNQLTIHNLFYFVPGANHHYSNTGYTILSEIIARVYSFRKGQTKLYSDYLYDYITGISTPVPVNVKFPHLASDVQMPSPYTSSITYYPGGDSTISNDLNMSAHVAEGNGLGTMAHLNTYIRSLMKGANVLNPSTVELMKTDLSPGSTVYGLGCSYFPNLGYGHNGATHGYLSLMVYDPSIDVSLIVLLPVWDLSNGMISFMECFNALSSAGYAARTALGYPGKP